MYVCIKICIYIYIYTHICACIYIYIYREREREIGFRLAPQSLRRTEASVSFQRSREEEGTPDCHTKAAMQRSLDATTLKDAGLMSGVTNGFVNRFIKRFVNGFDRLVNRFTGFTLVNP